MTLLREIFNKEHRYANGTNQFKEIDKKYTVVKDKYSQAYMKVPHGR